MLKAGVSFQGSLRIGLKVLQGCDTVNGTLWLFACSGVLQVLLSMVTQGRRPLGVHHCCDVLLTVC